MDPDTVTNDPNSAASLGEFIVQHLFTVIIVIFAGYIIWRGLDIMSEQIREKGIGSNNLQALGLFVIVPVVMVLGAERAIDGQVVSAILGSLVGYLYGVKQADTTQS